MSFKSYDLYKDSGIAWLGKAPATWKVSTLKHGFNIRLGKMLQPERKGDQDELAPYVRAANIELSGIDTSDIKLMWFSRGERLELSLQEGDLLVSEGGDVGRACLWSNELDNCHFQNSVNRVRSKPGNSTRFARYWLSALKDKGFIDVLCNKSTIAHYTAEKLAATPALLPSNSEQLAIATFLDRETAKIDALIAEQQRLIELLQEKRQAVISHAVTKGLDPDAPMKDSGVEWLGEVPEHWGVCRLRYIGTLQNGLNIGAESFGEGDPFVSYGDVYNNPIVPSQPAGLVRSTPDDKRKYGLKKGDILFTRTSETVDDIGVASTCLEPVVHSTFAGFLIRLRPFQGALEPRYSTHLFRNRGVKNHFAGTLNMVTRASLSQGELGDLPICIPPLEEQLEIAIYIEEMTEKSGHLISSARNLVSLLQERRSALISAAVTGQIDVRGHVPEEAGS